MSNWPANLNVAPIGAWPGGLTPDHRRQRSNFSAGWLDTTRLLRREMTHLQAKNGELLVAIRPEDFRLDGFPRSNAKQLHPGVILSFDSTVGHLSYPCDTFTTWQDNLRAVALALEALRKVDRYGVTKRGEQYRGFLAIEAAAAPAGFATADEAHRWLGETYGYDVRPGDFEQARGLLRHAQRKSHPDLGGDPELFHRVSLAEAKLREAGVL
jgi:hypothetical protein